MEESEEELKSLLKKLKEESEKVGLKLNIQKTNIMASDSITSWQIDGEKMETVTNFVSLAPKIRVNCDGSCEIKTLISWEKLYDKHSVLKSRDITLLTKFHLVKAMVFPGAMYGCESWTVKAEC